MKLTLMTLDQFSVELGSSSPAPGGGSASALAGVLSAALSGMVANLTVNKKGYENVFDEMRSVADQAEGIRRELSSLIDQDAESFNVFLSTMKLPKQTQEQKLLRAEKMQSALKSCCEIPMQVAQKSFDIFSLAEVVLCHGNSNAVTDALVSAMLARTAVLGALLNVEVNLLGIKDETYVSQMKVKIELLRSQAINFERRILMKQSF